MTREPIDWKIAATVGRRVGGSDPIWASYKGAALQAELDEIAPQAEAMVEAATGLRSLAGPARIVVVDRAGWVDANVASFRRLLRPITDSLGARLSPGPIAALGAAATGAELGALLGWMSGRVLGQYDLLVPEEAASPHGDDTDVVYLVGPNLLSLEKRFDLPPHEFRLWVTIHELTHRAQFTGVPWMREHYQGLVATVLGAAPTDVRSVIAGLARSLGEFAAGRNPLDDGGIPALIADANQIDALRRVGGLMSLLEGHGDVTMDRAAGGLIPSAERFQRLLSARRGDRSAVPRLISQLLGMDAKMRQYEAGEVFVHAVEAAGGRDLFDLVWADPRNLPTRTDIESPAAWITRMQPAAVAA